MEWNKITIDTTTEAVDVLSSELYDMGVSGVEIIDHVPLTEEEKKLMYVDLLPDDIAPDDGSAKLVCYFDEKEDLEDALLKIQQMIDGLSDTIPVGKGTVSLDVTKDEDWVNNWKKYFKPIRLDDQIVIKPTWESYKEAAPDDLVIEIDPGTAFGTGSHETTRLCLMGMKQYLKPNAKVLDIGCGSGILSIAALLLGADHAVLTDIDANVIHAVEDNFHANHIPKEQYDLRMGDVLTDHDFAEQLGNHCYDMLTANILADVILPLIPIAGNFLKPDGVFIMSGIIDTKEKEVVTQLKEHHFQILNVAREKDWVCIGAELEKL